MEQYIHYIAQINIQDEMLAAIKELAKAEDMEQAVKNASDLTLQ